MNAAKQKVINLLKTFLFAHQFSLVFVFLMCIPRQLLFLQGGPETPKGQTSLCLDQMDLTDIYRTFHPKETKYTFFLNAHGTLSKIEHMVGHKTSLNKEN